MNTKKIINTAITTLGIYLVYKNLLSLALSASSTLLHNLNLLTMLSAILIIVIGSILTINPKIISGSITCTEIDNANDIDLLAIRELITKIIGILLIVSNLQVAVIQFYAVNEQLAMNIETLTTDWMKINIAIRIILVLAGGIILVKSKRISKIIYRD